MSYATLLPSGEMLNVPPSRRSMTSVLPSEMDDELRACAADAELSMEEKAARAARATAAFLSRHGGGPIRQL